jgi:Fur family transcriptional regulator, ferric uptake regulator
MARQVEPKALDKEGIERAMSRLREAVKERGLKASSVREAVARAALTRRGHFTVDDLIHDLRDGKTDRRDAHMTTVYRTLPLLVDVGLLQLTLLSKGDEARYERAFEREHHDHLICNECGMVVEFHFEALEVLQRDIAEQYGFHLTDHVHELHGLCKSCRSKASGKRPRERVET